MAPEKRARVRNGYYKTKYGLTDRVAGRAVVHPDLAERGLLVIQLDALPYETLCTAMERGYLPFIRRQLLRGEFVLRKWYAGVPSNTPSVQAAVMYGNNDDIPSFRWYEKDAKLSVNFKNPLNAALVEERLNRFPGLLEGGSSYSNMFSGKAARSVATYGSTTTLDIGKRLRGLQIFLLVLLNLITVLRTIFYTVWEFAVEIHDWLRSMARGELQRAEYLFPLFRILMNVWVREIITVGALTDIANGSPAVYVSFLAYDELAHQRGPLSRSALATLRPIDARIRKIVQLAKRGIRREYDIFIFSDHGTAPSMPFFFLYGQTINHVVSELVDGTPPRHVREHPGEVQVTYARVLALKLESYERGLVHGVRYVVKAFRHMLLRRVAREQEPHHDGDDVIVTVAGGLGHVYLPIPGRPLDDAIQQRYPALIPGLVAHQGIGVVVTRVPEGIMIRSREGSATLDTSGKLIRVDGDPLPRIEPKDLAFRGLLKLMNMSNSGDLVLLGADHGNHLVNFEEQMAAHGGIGGLQNSAFILVHPRYSWVRDIDDPLQLHAIFSQVRTESAQTRDTQPVLAG
ncbi:MAG TPA: alkaline phosphatase family protein [Planctomycetota bacterium]|nr:alkaline phosphatase family protein [Planctomycetota bacterium]